MKVVIQGIEGCFHHLAVNAYYGKEVDIVPAESFSQLISILAKPNVCDAAIMAIENSIAGTIIQNYGLLQDTNIAIEGEIFLRIKQNLLALPGQKISDLKEVHSHPMAIHQCREFFSKYPHIKLVEANDTSQSAKYIYTNKLKHIGAIAGLLPAKLFKLDVLAESIESIANNQTRFLLLKRTEDIILNGGYTKASIYFRVKDNPGSLVSVLDCLAKENINLSKIQSHPVEGENWNYFFHLDLEFNEPMQFNKAIFNVKKNILDLKILGTYHRGLSI